MVEPTVVPRSEHSISRRDIDPDALKVLYRLRQFNYVAYLVGGSVRDLLLGRRPKDFDLGTNAHPYQVKRLFRNCWIIGRRFRLAHVKFGTKTVEVATFRRQIIPAVGTGQPEKAATEPLAAHDSALPDPEDLLIHHDNTFGTPEEDAFRRDFTINALFYDIGTFAIIDYVGGLGDLRARLVRSIGDPGDRFREDPVRMLRALALAARLDFTIDPPIYEAIGRTRTEITRAAAPRLLEEYLKILRAGAAERTFRALSACGLLGPVTPELHHGASDALWQSLGALDRYRSRFDTTPEGLTNAILLGSLLVPLGLAPGRPIPGSSGDGAHLPRATLGRLPLPRRDVERLRQTLALQRRLRDDGAPVRAKRALVHRDTFAEALTWLEIHGGAPDLVASWRAFVAESGSPHPAGPPLDHRPGARFTQPRRRRRRYHRPLADH